MRLPFRHSGLNYCLTVANAPHWRKNPIIRANHLTSRSDKHAPSIAGACQINVFLILMGSPQATHCRFDLSCRLDRLNRSLPVLHGASRYTHMRTFRIQTLLSVLGAFACCLTQGATVIVSDNYNVTGSGSGFALNTGINRGINPPTTRLTGSTTANLRYINTGTKATTAYTITSSKAQVDAAANAGRFVLSADGPTSFDYSTALGTAAATPTTPVVYDIAISIKNASSDNQRCSFALGTIESDAFSWAFGFQIYRTNSTMTKYLIGKRIDTTASGLVADLNSAITTLGAGTFGTELNVLMRVTDAGVETSAFHSRVQLSLD
ncbi:MAG: hypothetical protein JWO95_1892, partial [Verrucomicrobiales bacterium]|nr:hypothetical protein [Verrucomicrobiales bacterium]